jgi:hypothetical protein
MGPEDIISNEINQTQKKKLWRALAHMQNLKKLISQKWLVPVLSRCEEGQGNGLDCRYQNVVA